MKLKEKVKHLTQLFHACEVCIPMYATTKWFKKAGLIDDHKERFSVHYAAYDIDTIECVLGIDYSVPDRLYVVFKGTDEPRDWRVNFRGLPKSLSRVEVKEFKKYKGKRVARGYLEEFAEITYKKICPRIKDLVKLYGIKEIFFTGHSKGAPNSALTWLWAVNTFSIPCKCYQLSGPPWVFLSADRMINKIWKKTVNFICIVHNAFDPVPLLGWRHAGKYFHVGGPNPFRVIRGIILTYFDIRKIREIAGDHYPHLLMYAIYRRIKRINRILK